MFDAHIAARTPVAMRALDDAATNPNHDGRTTDQQRHDILAAMIDVISRHKDTPVIGGQSPTVLVSVRQKDLDTGKGVGFVNGLDTFLSMKTVKQYLCTGGTQQVLLNDSGGILALGTQKRVFNREQRRAIILRDGQCIIPGCSIPASWCEIHHVIPYQHGGPTHTSNGVAVCWYHHATIDTAGWQIRISKDVPEIKPPPWINATAGWQKVTKSPTTILDHLDDDTLWDHDDDDTWDNEPEHHQQE